jgi:hypothetical protein
MTYENYKITLNSNPSSYDVSQNRTNEINRILSSMILDEFPGIEIEITPIYNMGKTTGPEQNTIDEINNWISENWTAAL